MSAFGSGATIAGSSSCGTVSSLGLDNPRSRHGRSRFIGADEIFPVKLYAEMVSRVLCWVDAHRLGISTSQGGLATSPGRIVSNYNGITRYIEAEESTFVSQRSYAVSNSKQPDGAADLEKSLLMAPTPPNVRRAAPAVLFYLWHSMADFLNSFSVKRKISAKVCMILSK